VWWRCVSWKFLYRCNVQLYEKSRLKRLARDRKSGIQGQSRSSELLLFNNDNDNDNFIKTQQTCVNESSATQKWKATEFDLDLGCISLPLSGLQWQQVSNLHHFQILSLLQCTWLPVTEKSFTFDNTVKTSPRWAIAEKPVRSICWCQLSPFYWRTQPTGDSINRASWTSCCKNHLYRSCLPGK